jgi:predicted AlkP superfamily pyrophosphatase or phosphodiesterase
MKPTFPCLTFPSHAALATGTTTGGHGITMDHFMIDGEVVENPGAEQLLAEPIWKTATRQGIRTMVHDWPMAQGLPEDAAAISLSSYDPALTDQQRLDTALAAWEADSAGPGADNKLRLVMLRLTDIINSGKANGPRADEVFEVVGATSTALEGFFGQLEEKWETIGPPGSSLAVIVTTDHGLAELTTQVNLEQLLAEQSFAANLEMVTSGAIAHLFFKDLPENEGQRAIFEENFDSEMKRNIYFRTYKPEDLPEDWNYNVEGRIGDRVLVLKSRYAFTDFKGEEAIFAPAEGDGIFAAWGYPVESSVRMLGQAIVWGLPDSPIRSMATDIDTTVFHATATKLLGIEAAASATGQPLD